MPTVVRKVMRHPAEKSKGGKNRFGKAKVGKDRIGDILISFLKENTIPGFHSTGIHPLWPLPPFT
jgi:hypothetical protein